MFSGVSVAANAHERLIQVLSDELMLEVLLLLAQDIDTRENKELNLVVMEIVYFLTKDRVGHFSSTGGRDFAK